MKGGVVRSALELVAASANKWEGFDKAAYVEKGRQHAAARVESSRQTTALEREKLQQQQRKEARERALAGYSQKVGGGGQPRSRRASKDVEPPPPDAAEGPRAAPAARRRRSTWATCRRRGLFERIAACRGRCAAAVGAFRRGGARARLPRVLRRAAASFPRRASRGSHASVPAAAALPAAATGGWARARSTFCTCRCSRARRRIGRHQRVGDGIRRLLRRVSRDCAATRREEWRRRGGPRRRVGGAPRADRAEPARGAGRRRGGGKGASFSIRNNTRCYTLTHGRRLSPHLAAPTLPGSGSPVAARLMPPTSPLLQLLELPLRVLKLPAVDELLMNPEVLLRGLHPALQLVDLALVPLHAPSAWRIASCVCCNAVPVLRATRSPPPACSGGSPSTSLLLLPSPGSLSSSSSGRIRFSCSSSITAHFLRRARARRRRSPLPPPKPPPPCGPPRFVQPAEPRGWLPSPSRGPPSPLPPISPLAGRSLLVIQLRIERVQLDRFSSPSAQHATSSASASGRSRP